MAVRRRRAPGRRPRRTQLMTAATLGIRGPSRSFASLRRPGTASPSCSTSSGRRSGRDTTVAGPRSPMSSESSASYCSTASSGRNGRGRDQRLPDPPRGEAAGLSSGEPMDQPADRGSGAASRRRIDRPQPRRSRRQKPGRHPLRRGAMRVTPKPCNTPPAASPRSNPFLPRNLATIAPRVLHGPEPQEREYLETR